MLVVILKFIFWFFFISYLIKILARIFAPILMKYFAARIKDKFEKNYYYSQKKSHQQEGDVTIDSKSKSQNKKSNDIGEYVDFEEVDE